MSAEHRRNRNKKRLLVYGVASAVVVAATTGTLALASPGLLGLIAADPRLALPMATLAASPRLASRWFSRPR